MVPDSANRVFVGLCSKFHLPVHLRQWPIILNTIHQLQLRHMSVMALKSPAIRLFRASNQKNTKPPYYWPCVKGNHWWPVDSPHKVPAIRKASTSHDVIMWWPWMQYMASMFVPSQWKTALLCNDASHWLDANLESPLQYTSQRLKITCHLCLSHESRQSKLFTTFTAFKIKATKLQWCDSL